MSKKYKVKRRKDPRSELKKEARKVNWHLVLTVFGATLLFFCVYQTAIYFEFKYIVHIYSILAGILALCFGIFNRGFSRFDPESVIFPSDYTEEQRAVAIEKEAHRRKRARLFLIPLIGILITLAIDMVYLFYILPIIK